MTMNYTASVKNVRAQALASKIDAATDPAHMIIYSGARPLGVGAITDQVALVTLVLKKPCYTSITDGILYLDTIVEQMVMTSGHATWARIVDGSGTPVGDMDIGVAGSGADIVLPTVDLIQGSYVRITAGQIREG